MPRPCNAGDPGPTSADRLFERRTCPIDAADLLFRKAATAWGWGKSDHCVSWKDGWHGTNARWSGLIVKGAPELGVGPMVRDDARSGIRYHLKVHSFRTLTVILAWIFLALAFYQDPAVLTGAQRLIQRGIEFVGDNIPPPWGPRIEFVFREVGGLIWLQITLLVLALRVVLSTIAMIFRAARRRSAELYLD